MPSSSSWFWTTFCCCLPSEEAHATELQPLSSPEERSPQKVLSAKDEGCTILEPSWPTTRIPQRECELKAAAEICARSLETLAWKVNVHSGNGRRFYSSVMDGRMQIHAPLEYRRGDLDDVLLGDIKFMQDVVLFCSSYGLVLELAPMGLLVCDDFGVRVRGKRPLLTHCRFYAHFLQQELSLYPQSFLRRCGMRRIMLVSDLRWCSQVRAAIPAVHSGILYLDPGLKDMTYLLGVFHHELFHIVDIAMAAVVSGSVPPRPRRVLPSQGDLDAFHPHHHHRESSFAGTAATSSSAEQGHPGESLPGTCTPDSFAAPLEQSWIDRRFPVAQRDRERLRSLADGLVYELPTKSADPRWSCLNRAGFVYGRGGAFAREADAWTPSSVGNMSGFLNKYSMSALEEDKAEIYAGLLRSPLAMERHADTIIQQKAQLLRRRLEAFCPDLDDAFWARVQAKRAKRRITKHANNVVDWIQRRTKEGSVYWYNKSTRQASWWDPKSLSVEMT